MRYIRAITVGLFVLTLAAWIASSVMFNRNADEVKPVITADSDQIEVSVKDGEEGLFKGLEASDNKDGDLTDKIIIGKQSKFIEKGVSEVTFLVFDSSNNVGEYKRKVRYKDYESPKFELSKPFVYEIGDNVTILDRLTVTDAVEGDISDKMKIVSSNVDMSEPGIYTVGVEASNRFGDTVSAEFPVNIVENNKNVPVIKLNTYLVELKKGDAFEPGRYLENVTLVDGSVVGTEGVQISNQVKTYKAGIYQVVYSYTDFTGLTGHVSLAVVVEE